MTKDKNCDSSPGDLASTPPVTLSNPGLESGLKQTQYTTRPGSPTVGSRAFSFPFRFNAESAEHAEKAPKDDFNEGIEEIEESSIQTKLIRMKSIPFALFD